MKHVALRKSSVSAALALALCMVSGIARADDYADVGKLLREGKPDEALAKADAYITGKPRDPQMRFMRGVILSEQGRGADATVVFTQLTQDFPELPEPYNNLAALYAAQGQFDKARAALETAIKLKPDYATAFENLGDVYGRLAAQSYGRAQQLDAGSKSLPPKLTLVRQLFVTAQTGVGAAPPIAPPPRRTVGKNSK
jgi:Flp pilus assembly protein TadD